MRISDWSSDVCSSDLGRDQSRRHPGHAAVIIRDAGQLERAGDRTGAAKQLRHVGETVGGEEMAADADRAVVGLEIGRAHVCTPVPNAYHVCRIVLAKKHTITNLSTSAPHVHLISTLLS